MLCTNGFATPYVIAQITMNLGAHVPMSCGSTLKLLEPERAVLTDEDLAASIH
jgi:hypothetical protein